MKAESSSPTLQPNGILKTSSPNRPRSDSYGNQIKTGGKKHKIGFKPKMVDVVEVESYKQYNADEAPQENKSCCVIF